MILVFVIKITLWRKY